MSGQAIRFTAADVDQPQTVHFGAGDVGADAQAPQPPASVLDALISLLPAAGGAAGGIVGGIGGTVGGMGVGGVPGAIGGAALGGSAGEALRQLVERFRGHAAPATPGEAAKQIGVQGAEQGGLEAAGGLVTKVAGKAATAVMRGYLKPSLAQRSIKDAREIVQTALDEALPVGKAGEERAGRLIADLNKQVNSILANAKGKVDLTQVADKVRAFAKAKYFKPGVDASDYRAALDVADAIDNHASLSLPNGAKVTKVNASSANEIKQAVRPASRAYGAQGAAAETATRKVAGSEMRQAIERVSPEVGPLNAREGRLIDAQDAITRAAGREENRNPLFGVPTLISGAVGAEESYRRDPVTGLTMALALRAGLTPQVATRAAILASRFARLPGMVPANAARIAIAYASGQQPEE